MNRIHRKLEYALIALRYIGKKEEGDLTTAKEVCEKIGIPFDATARVMQIMTAKGLLRSEQGVRGGYAIAKDLNGVSLLDLMNMILGPTNLAKCIGEEGHCELVDKCNILRPIESLNQRIKRFYSELSLEEVLNPKSIELRGLKSSGKIYEHRQ